MNNNKHSLLYILCGCELVERFVYFGVFTVLVLYLKSAFHFTDDHAFVIFGLFSALSYAFLLLGGLIADKLLGQSQSVLLALLCLIIATLLLTRHHLSLVYYGLSIMLLGSALLKVNLTTLVGKTADDHLQREKNFTLFYVCMNIGAVMGPVLFGIMSHWLGWGACFYISFALLLLIFWVLATSSVLREFRKTEKKRLLITILLLFAISLLVWLLFNETQFEALAVVVIVVLSAALFIRIAKRSKKHYQKKILGLLIIYAATVFFFACSFQVATSITLFIQRDLHRTILGWLVPTPMFSALDPLFVVLMAPLLVYLWRYLKTKGIEPYVTTKIALGIFAASAAYFVLNFTAEASLLGAVVLPLILIVLVNVLLGGGEICLAPPVFTAATEHSPPQFTSTMIGAWFLFASFSGYIASLLSRLSSNNPLATRAVSLHIYAHAFLFVAIIALFSGLLVLLSKRLVQHLLA